MLFKWEATIVVKCHVHSLFPLFSVTHTHRLAQIIKPLEANCYLWYWAIEIKLTWPQSSVTYMNLAVLGPFSSLFGADIFLHYMRICQTVLPIWRIVECCDQISWYQPDLDPTDMKENQCEAQQSLVLSHVVRHCGRQPTQHLGPQGIQTKRLVCQNVSPDITLITLLSFENPCSIQHSGLPPHLTSQSYEYMGS